MRRAALFLALLAAPAAAQSDDLLECPTTQMTAAFRDKLAAAMLGQDSPDTDAMLELLAAAADRCADQHGLAAEKREAFFLYAVSRMPHDAFVAKLGTVGISAAVIDDALGFGPGRSNPIIKGNLSAEQLDKLLGALSAQGVDIDRVPQPTWEMVGGYAAATSQMWQAQAKLR